MFSGWFNPDRLPEFRESSRKLVHVQQRGAKKVVGRGGIRIKLYSSSQLVDCVSLVICGQKQLPERAVRRSAIWILLNCQFQLRDSRGVLVLRHISAGQRFVPVLPRGVHPE